MSQEVTQWLAEIQSLKQQLAAAQTEREEAYASAANWRQLYETEARQRRTEAKLSRQTIEQLQQDLRQVQQRLTGTPSEAAERSTFASEVAQIASEDDLRSRLIDALAECDRLSRALQTEQDHHAETRKSLTIALGDAIDMLAKETNAANG